MRFEVVITEKVRHRYIVDARTSQEAVLKAATDRAAGVDPDASSIVDTNVSKPVKLLPEPLELDGQTADVAKK